jgi:peptide/nickel transport system substrate-binding protein
MTSPDPRPVSRRDFLKYGAGGAAGLAIPLVAGALPASASSRLRSAARQRPALPTRPRGAIKKGGRLKFARSIAPTTLDPANTIIAGDIYTLDKIMEPLYVTSPSGDLTPWLATGYSVSSDGKTYTFSLRPGVKFSDGTPLTPADVIFSINRARLDQAGPLSFLDYAIKSISANGSDEVVFQLSTPWAPFVSDISVFANAIYPANFGGKSAAEFFKAPIGTGPFTVSGFTPDASSLTLTANPHYWQPGKPYLDAVVFDYVDNGNERVLELQGGETDIIDLVPPSSFAALKANDNLVTYAFPAWEVDLLVLNEKLPYFADVHVRRAITYAIDRPGLVAAASFGTAKPGGSVFPPSLQYYSADTPVLGYSIAKAEAELKQSKYPKGFSTKLLIDGGVPQYVTFATLIKAYLGALNIDVTITPLAHSAFEATFRAYDYEMFIDYAINDISDPDEMASFNFTPDGGSESYWSHFSNSTVSALVGEAESELDPTKRAALYAKIQATLAELAPVVPLDYAPYLYGTQKSVQGFAVNPGGAYRLEDVWLT